ncbi:MAG: hypothetical protein IIB09_09205, partial [Bacteroidetes bacterium]|nr:hypothetical protein [Bacteroidota bacterium]
MTQKLVAAEIDLFFDFMFPAGTHADGRGKPLQGLRRREWGEAAAIPPPIAVAVNKQAEAVRTGRQPPYDTRTVYLCR